MLRMLAFAVISEIPFDLMFGGSLFYPFHQNVLWSFLIALAGMRLMEKARSRHKLWLSITVCTAVCIIGTVMGYVIFADYYGAGVLTVFVFYFFNRRNEENAVSYIWKKGSIRNIKTLWTVICLVGQIVCLYFINVEMLGGLYYTVELFGLKIELFQQGLAILALFPIWLYNGKPGYDAKWFKYFKYAFYPAHCLILALAAMFV